jgi:DNA polymerase/3'-5' exonuclease PolX
MSKGDPIQLDTAIHIAGNWAAKWKELSPETEFHICGSIRRKEKMIRDIDILVIDPDMHGTFEKGTIFEGIELNLCFVKKECEGAGLLFLTGDYKFNIALRSKAKGMGMKLNRYGLFRGDDVIASETEHSIFKALKTPYVAPEKRKSPNGQKGIEITATGGGTIYEVFITEVHGFNFCDCRGYQYRRSCKHLNIALEKVS